MTSSRVILGLLGFILLIIIVLSGRRIIDTLKTRIGQAPKQEEVKEVQITNTPEEQPTAMPSAGQEIPQTGPTAIMYILLGGGVLAGIVIKKMA